MSEYAPDAIWWLGREIISGFGAGEISGIVGDQAHTYGYHRCRNVLPADDYSVQLLADKQGDGWAASALDVSLPASLMRTVTQRLLDSAKDHNDPRLDPVREFFGTLDGTTVTGWDCIEYSPSTSDSSHLWHVHLSILRKYANDTEALKPVLEVILGKPLAVQAAREDDDMPQCVVIDLPEKPGETKTYTVPPSNFGTALWGPATASIGLDPKYLKGLAVRLAFGNGHGGWDVPDGERVVVDAKHLLWLHNVGVEGRVVSMERLAYDASDKGGHVALCLEYGSRA